MKRITAVAFMLIAIPFVLGMGGLVGNTTSETIPRPEKKFSAIFVDQNDVLTECSEVSIEGKTFLEGKRGKGEYTVPFENIHAVAFFLEGGELTIEITLKEKKETIALVTKKNFTAYGRTPYGTYRIKLENLKKLLLK